MKRFASLLLSLFLLGILAGCGLDLDFPVQAPIPLKFWCSIPYEDGPREMLEDFNRTHPDIEVQYIYCTDDTLGHKRLDTALDTGGDVDVCINDAREQVVSRAERGWLLPLDPLLEERSIDAEALYGAGADPFRPNGMFYSLPSRLFNQTILYNEDMFLEKGVPLPRVGWTYEEFYSAAQALSGEGVYGYFSNFIDQGEPALSFLRAQLGEDWMYTEDGSAVAIDRPEVRYALEQYLRRTRNGIEPDFTENKIRRMNPEALFLQGRTAMVLDHWTVRCVKDLDRYPHRFKVGFATLPRLGGEEQEQVYSTVYGGNISIAADTLHPDAAMTFLMWYITEGVCWLTPKGLIPAAQVISPGDTAASLFAGSEELFDLDSAGAVFLTSQAAHPPRYFTAIQDIQFILQQEFEKAYTGAATVEEAVSAAQLRAQAAFDAAK